MFPPSRGPSTEEIRNYLAFLAPENHTDQFSVVLGVGECNSNIPVLYIEATETNSQREKKETLPILTTLALLTYHRTPDIGHLRQPPVIFQLGQFE